MKAEDILGDNENFIEFNGIKGRKGSVAATIQNVKALNALSLIPDSEDKMHAIEAILCDQRGILESLKAAGVFDLFSLEEWMDPSQGEGRVWVGLLFLQSYPDTMTPSVEKSILLNKGAYSILLQEEVSKFK